MNSRERVIRAIQFEPIDRLPKDLGGMRSTGISVFAYPRLVEALGLPPRLPRAEDTFQMLALPDLDVLDALGVDVVTIADGTTNAFNQPEVWKPYDFGGRLPALVRDPSKFKALPDGTVMQGTTRMVPSSYVFDEAHGGQPVSLSDDLPKIDVEKYRRDMQNARITDEKVKSIRDLCRRVRESTDRAIFFNDGALQIPIGLGAFSGIGIFPMQCITDPDYVRELHQIAAEYTLYNVRALLPEIAPYIDIIMIAADDWGTQKNLLASPQVYRDLFKPYYRLVNDECHRIAPQVKMFLHSCGAIYNLIDEIVDTHFDILNPVQWSAGKHSIQEWKDKARGRIALWGGGVNSQVTLPLGSVEDVVREAQEATAILGEGSGYVFCNIHNILAEIDPKKVIAMYRAV